MKITAVLSQSGLEREEIEITVPGSAELDVTVTLRSVTRNQPSPDDARVGAFGPLTSTDEKTQKISRAAWDNLIAALATQKASKR